VRALTGRSEFGAVTPREVVRSSFQLNPMFRGFGQQDSQACRSWRGGGAAG
jgi:hypothetical protein